jgi:superfamily II DNA or RNA helicase
MKPDRSSDFQSGCIRGAGQETKADLLDKIDRIPDDEGRIILATRRYLGEGFDDARLDILFLTLPVSWRGTLAQYAGRLHRVHEANKDVIIYDHADLAVPVLAKMYKRLRPGYTAIGYELDSASG